VTGSVRAAMSLKTQLIKDGSLVRPTVVPWAKPTLCKTELLVQTAGSEVRFADFKDDSFSPLRASRGGDGLEQRAADTFTTDPGCDHDIFDFPLRRDNPRYGETANGVSHLGDDNDSPDGGRLTLSRKKEVRVASGRPVRGRFGSLLQREQCRNVRGARWADVEGGLDHGLVGRLLEPC